MGAFLFGHYAAIVAISVYHIHAAINQRSWNPEYCFVFFFSVIWGPLIFKTQDNKPSAIIYRSLPYIFS